MTSREAMQALLDGKKLQRKDGTGCVHLVDDELVWTCGSAALIPGKHYEIYENPNPHAKGTFAWAREEAMRGRAVRRGSWVNTNKRTKSDFSSTSVWQIKSYEATDWEVVP